MKSTSKTSSKASSKTSSKKSNGRYGKSRHCPRWGKDERQMLNKLFTREKKPIDVITKVINKKFQNLRTEASFHQQACWLEKHPQVLK